MSEDAPAIDVVKPVEADAETVDDQELEAGGEPTKVEGKPSDPSPEKSNVDKRIDKLTWQNHETKRELQTLRAENEQLKATPETVAEAPKTLEDFEYDDVKYQAYVNEQTTENATQAALRIVREEQSQAQEKQRRTDFEAKEKSFSGDLTDYLEVTRSMSLTQGMYETASEMDNGPGVLYYLGKNPEIAGDIANLSPYMAAAELGKIEEKLSIEKATPKAPPPPPKIDGGNPSVNKNYLTDDVSQAEFNKQRRKYKSQR